MMERKKRYIAEKRNTAQKTSTSQKDQDSFEKYEHTSTRKLQKEGTSQKGFKQYIEKYVKKYHHYLKGSFKKYVK
jgi:hypothetical protein